MDIKSPARALKFLALADRAGIKYTKNITEFPSFLQHYDFLIQPIRIQLVVVGQYAGRFIPRSAFDDLNNDMTAATHSVTETRVVFVSIGLNVSSAVVGNDEYNAIVPS